MTLYYYYQKASRNYQISVLSKQNVSPVLNVKSLNENIISGKSSELAGNKAKLVYFELTKCSF